MADADMKAAAEADLVYKLEDKPPFANALLSAITHLLAIFVPMVTPALIVGGALKLRKPRLIWCRWRWWLPASARFCR